jgi:putative DNA primase/helicase
MTAMDNIVRLATLQEDGELPPAAEDAIALLFAERFSDALRFVDDWGRWMRFGDAYWRRDTTRNAFDLVRTVCREVALECEKAVTAVASAKTVAAVERLAKSDRRLAATTAQWNAGEWAFSAAEDDDAA